MESLKIKPDTLKIDGLSEKVRAYFSTKYSITDNHLNEITIAKDKAIGCKIILTNRRLMINGIFPTSSRLTLALVILILGGIIIPMMVYIFVFKPKFDAIEKEVHDYIQSNFSEDLIPNGSGSQIR